MSKPSFNPEEITEKNQADLFLRHVSQLYPERYAKSFLPKGVRIRALSFQPTEFAARQRRLDRTLALETNKGRILQHWEWEKRPKANLAFRIFEYSSLCMMELARPGQQQKASAIESIVVLLGGRKAPWPEHGHFQISPEGLPFSGVHFRILPIYQKTLKELFTMGDPFWLIFSPLAVDAKPEAMKRAVDRLRRLSNAKDFIELVAAMIALAQHDHRKRRLYKAIIEAIHKKNSPKETEMPHWFYELGFEKGIKTGVKQGIEQGVKQGLEKGITKGVRQGLKEGRIAEARAILKRLLVKRKLRPSAEHKATIDACSDLATLELWLDRAAVADHIAEVLIQP